MVGVNYDITERKRARETLRQNEAKKAFASSHLLLPVTDMPFMVNTRRSVWPVAASGTKSSL